MAVTYLPLSALSRTTYEDVGSSLFLLHIYRDDLLKLQRYLNTRIQHSPEYAEISSICRLSADITIVTEKATQDFIYLSQAETSCIGKDGDVVDVFVPWYFLHTLFICRAVLMRTHPLVKLYDKYQHLFVDIERSDGCTAYSSRTLF